MEFCSWTDDGETLLPSSHGRKGDLERGNYACDWGRIGTSTDCVAMLCTVNRFPLRLRHRTCARLASDKPDEHDTEHSGQEASDAQRGFRALDRACGQPFRGSGKSGEKKPFDDENETDRYEELSHLRDTAAVTAKERCYLAGEPAGGAALGAAGLRAGAAPSWDLPAGSPKNRKKSESGLSSMRVSLERSPAS
jgi:hypothetical protein